jgi:hypothetical protein
MNKSVTKRTELDQLIKVALWTFKFQPPSIKVVISYSLAVQHDHNWSLAVKETNVGNFGII